MIKNWTLKNFKSIKTLEKLEMAQINIIAGANSSGKSTLIQSILLLKQTLQYGSANRPIALNGPLLRLGSFDDVCNYDSDGEDLEIGFQFEFDDADFSGPLSVPWSRSLRRYTVGSESGAVRDITISLSYRAKMDTAHLAFTRPGGQANLTPDLARMKLTISRLSGGEAIKEAFASFSKTVSSSVDDESSTFTPFDYEVKLDSDSIAEITAGKPEASVQGSFLSHFLPVWIAVHYDAAAQRITQIADILCSPSISIASSVKLLADHQLSPAVGSLISDWLVKHGEQPIELSADHLFAKEVRDLIIPLLRRARSHGILSENTSGRQEQIVADLVELREQILSLMRVECSPEYEVEVELPRSVGAATEFLREFFKQGIRYLGPLRDSPRPVYQLEALESTTDVGYRGEHTAAVLDLNGTSPITYRSPPSENFDVDYASTSALRRATLHDGVVEWLKYLGVADEVVTTDAGVFGNRLQVSTDGLGRLHDLTNVGVGVSQVLPIVVMSLLAPRGSFLIFEQPELHLHPKVQARLADFFLALALDGKQTLLETHSEYLVDRFRLRIALSGSDIVRPLISILFSEKIGGHSTLSPVEVSEYGSILNWPKDFFEQSQRDVGRIIRAASGKRQKKSS